MEHRPAPQPLDPFLLPDLLSTKRTTDLDIEDLQLLHHFLTVTSLLLSAHDSQEAQDLWRVHAVRLGFKHEFLLRGILAVAALHMGYLLPDRRSAYQLKASTHQEIALQSFQDTLGRVDESNCHALFTFSCLIIVMAFASPRKEDPQTEILHWFHLLRGCNSVLQLHWDLLRNSFLSPLLQEMSYTVTKAAHHVPDTDRIMDLQAVCCNPAQPREVSQAYSLAIHELLKVFIQASVVRSRGEGTVLASLVWPINLSPKFLELLAEQQAEAMVILAHYCILLHWGDEEDEWFLRGWARYTLDTIKASIGESWHESLAWPEEVVYSCSRSNPEYQISAARRRAVEMSVSTMRHY